MRANRLTNQFDESHETPTMIPKTVAKRFPHKATMTVLRTPTKYAWRYVQQVLLNLVRNGIDAMVGKPSAERHVMLHARVDSPDTVRIEITDNGSGISDAVRDNLFLPFFTTKSGGMGMGLAISRSIITAHGGRLDCRNNPEGGAMFYVILPTRTEE